MTSSSRAANALFFVLACVSAAVWFTGSGGGAVEVGGVVFCAAGAGIGFFSVGF
jgi:hypothetical protein